MAPIRKGDGTGFTPKGFAGVRKGDGTILYSAEPAIPDSVVNQYTAENFSSPWPDNIGNSDMTVSGLVSDSFSNGEASVFGDGTDDYGLASKPIDLPENETFGVAFTFSTIEGSDLSTWFQGSDENSSFGVRDSDFEDSSTGELFITMSDDNGNFLSVETNSSYTDGNIHAVVINKTGNSAADIDVFVDDMDTPVSTTTIEDDPFDHTNYDNAEDLGFFARNDTDGQVRFKSYDAGIFEFNSSPYSQSERDRFVSRRPEV